MWVFMPSSDLLRELLGERSGVWSAAGSVPMPVAVVAVSTMVLKNASRMPARWREMSGKASSARPAGGKVPDADGGEGGLRSST